MYLIVYVVLDPTAPNSVGVVQYFWIQFFSADKISSVDDVMLSNFVEITLAPITF